MTERTVQLVLQYDGSRFAGWQRQPNAETVQGTLETVFERLFETPTKVIGAGRTDAGVHARGQAAHLKVRERWTPASVRRAANALLPGDVWIAECRGVSDSFHARYSATSRRYTYLVGTDDAAASPFRRRFEWKVPFTLVSEPALTEAAAALVGTHQFYGFAVRGTAPDTDNHACSVFNAVWERRDGTLAFTIEANRFLHHMVRFLVATMIDVAAGRRTLASFVAQLHAGDNSDVSAPAPAHGLFLDHVSYPAELYADTV